ncbi:MAG: alpha/beta hydrolase, partial [bacterium]
MAVNGVRVAHYNQGQGPALVLLHGLATSCFLWRDVIATLKHRYHVVAPDLLGLGDSSGPMDADQSLSGQAAVVEGLMNRLELRDAVVVGHDLGGGVAQLMALERSRRVAGVVLVSSVAYDNWPVPVIKKLRRLARWRPIWQAAVRAGMTRSLGFADQGFRRGVKYPGSIDDQTIDEYLRPHRLSVSSREHLRRLLLALDNRETVLAGHRLGTLTLPALVVWGSDDAFLPVAWAHRLAADIRGARLHILNDCGHFVPEE